VNCIRAVDAPRPSTARIIASFTEAVAHDRREIIGMIERTPARRCNRSRAENGMR